MKNLAASSLLLFFIQIAHAQNNPAAQRFIRSVFHEKGIVYTNTINGEIIDRMRAALKKDTIYSRVEGADTLIFTQEEKMSILKEVNKLKMHSWSSGLIENSTFINIDSLKKMINRPDGWKFFHQHYGTVVFRFSNPIFLRAGHLCIFYLGYWCDGLCGLIDLTIYVKREGQWESTFILYDEIN